MEQNKRIQEIRLLENSIQNLLMQRQVFQIEFAETDSALNQLESSGDEVFKIVGQLMIKTGREKAKDELANKKKVLELRIKSVEKQESSFTERIESLKKEILRENKKSAK